MPGIAIPASTTMVFQCWSTLPEAERLLCVGQTLLRKKFDGRQAWPPAGCLLERWEQEIDFKVGKILGDEENESLVRDSDGLGYTCSHVLLMLSKAERRKAIPFIVCYHEDKKKAKGAVKVLSMSNEMRRFGFQYLALKGPLILAGDGPSQGPHPGYPAWNIDSVCGKHVLACRPPIDSQTQGIRATLGGVLKFGPESYYGLTSAHVFFNLFDRRKQTTSSKEDIGIGHSLSDARQFQSAAGAGNRPHPSNITPEAPASHAMFSIHQEDEVYDLENRHLVLKASDQHIGNVFHRDSTVIDPTRLYNPSLDWTLFEITNPRLWRSNITRLSESTSFIPRPGYNKKQAPGGNLIVLSGPGGPEAGVGLGMKSNICLPWSGKFVQAWLLDCELGVGSCGSWVIEPDSAVICGVIVAGSPETGLSWMLPADPIFKDILEKWEGSYEAPQDVFQISRDIRIDLEIDGNKRPGERRRDDGVQGSLPQIILPQHRPSSLAQAGALARSGVSSLLSTMSEAGRVRNPSVVSSDPSNFAKSTGDTVSELESSRTSQPTQQGQRTVQQRASKSDLKDVLGLPDVAFEFVYNCGDGFDAWYEFMDTHPNVLSVPVESFIKAASAAQAENLGGVMRSCVSKAVLLENYTSRVLVREVLREYFKPLIDGDREAMEKFFARRDELRKRVREQSESQQ
ncbi:hypothetical protein A1O1_05077 [Capronia coronata CBS 617.96]|uniref:Uncharacterized protein n=1 Tax=Capronia coronata CBS 617.96 TaxID=1182541 RepID=W9Z0U6_9EURO|nr:uncharacterized protein A1O1_05077 [Capronia coronata CBS 617.96]EXJ88149.1 hypothetical protein A1O1_05077 [Capronia coronata CBS 617.96]